MQLTLTQLASACAARIDRAQMWLPYIQAAIDAYGIDTPDRCAAFLAQIGHESGGLKFASEIWGPTPAQARYEGRLDLGNCEPGDGSRFRGHGLIQTTGRANHAKVRDRLREKFPDVDVPDFEEEPQLLADPKWAALSAADFWDMKGLNGCADAGDFFTVSKRINGINRTTGEPNGYEDRVARWETAKGVLA